MKIKTKIVNGLIMEKDDLLPNEHKIKIRLLSDRMGKTLSLSDDDESIALAVAYEEIEKLICE